MGGDRETKYRLSLDAKGFNGVAREARTEFDSMVRGFAAGSGKLGELASAAGPAGLAVAALGGAAVVAGGAVAKFLFSSAEGAVELSGRISELSAKTGQGVEAIQAFGGAARLTGGSMESASSAVELLQRRLVMAPDGFRKLSLSVEELRNASPDQMLLAVSNRLRELPEGFQRTAAATAALGRGAAANLAFLSSDIQGAADRAKQLGQVLSGDAVKALDVLGDEITVTGDTWEGFKNQLGAALAQNPAVIEGVRNLTEMIGALATKIKENQAVFDKFFAAAGNFTGIHLGSAMDQAATFLQTNPAVKRGAGRGIESGFANGVTPGGMDAGSLAILERALVVTELQLKADEKLTLEAKKRAEEISRIGASYSKAGAQAEMDKLSKGIADAAKHSSFAAPKLEELRGKVLALMQAGAVATPVLTGLGVAVMRLQGRDLGIAQFNLGVDRSKTKAQQVMGRDSGVVVTGNLADPLAKNYRATVDWSGAVQDLDAAFRLLGLDATSALGGIAASIGLGITAFARYKSAADGVKNAKDAYEKSDTEENRRALADARAAQMQQRVMGGINAGGTAVSIWQDNKYQRSAGAGFASGAGKGAAAGAAFGPYGMIVGAVVGGIIGALSGGEFRKVCKEAGATLGGEVSTELGKAIMATSKKHGLSTKDASLLHLTDFMAETGKTATEMGPQIEGLFDGIISGAIPAKLGMEQLNTVFDELAVAASKGDVAAQRMTASLLQQGIAAGKLTDSMQAFANDALAKMAGGASKILEGVGMMGDTPLGEMGTAAAQSFAAGFTAQIGQVGLVQAITESGEGISAFHQKLLEEGNTAAAAMLAPWVQLSDAINNADPALKGFLTTLQGMGEVFGGLDQLGFATQGAFDGLTAGIGGTVNALAEAGITGPAALQAIAPQLAQVVAAHEKYGFTIDASTQGLLDQAAAAGIAFPTDPLTQMVDLLKQLIVVMGGVPKELNITTNYRTNGTPPVGGAPIEVPGSPAPLGAASGFGPKIAPNVGNGLGPLIQTHAGEGILIVPRSKVRAGGLFHAVRGYGRDGEEGGGYDYEAPDESGGGTTADEEGTYSAGPGESAAEAVAAALAPVADQIASLVSAVETLASQPTQVNVNNSPQVIVREESLVRTRDSVEEFNRMTLPAVARALANNSEGLRSKVKEIALEVFRGR